MGHLRFIRLFPFLLFLLLILPGVPPLGAGDPWLPVNREDLEMKQYAPWPGAHAVVLYREEETDDTQFKQSYYYRIKILSEEGKKYANVEIPYFEAFFRIHDLKARTIQPSGAILEFKGQVYQKTVVKARGVKFLAKTFSFPDVQVGSIIEYRYTTQWEPTRLANRWILQEELPTRRAVFRVKPNPFLALYWLHIRVPGNKRAVEQKDKVILMELDNVPPFEEEDYIPPENELKMRVDFFYTSRDEETPEKFWKREGKEWYEAIEKFIGKRGGIATAAGQLTQPEDSPEVKLRKIYDRVQQIRNLSYERTKTEKEEKREKLKDNQHVEDVWKRGYGYRNEINRLFVALARAAGFDATVVRVSERDAYFFSQGLLNPNQLDGEVAVVRQSGQDLFVDPGTLFCPFGLIAWQRTGVKGIRIDKEGGEFVTTPQPRSEQALQRRTAEFELLDDGTLKGTLRVDFLGLEALRRRLSAREEDEEGRRKQVEDEIKAWLPASATVEDLQITNWETSDAPLHVECKLTLPNYAAFTGRRMLLPASVFEAGRKHAFQSAKRVHPVYFRSPFQEVDDITFRLPDGFRVETLAQPRKIAADFGGFEAQQEASTGRIRLQRRLVMEGFLFGVEHYAALRSFLDKVSTSDEERLVLQSAESDQDR